MTSYAQAVWGIALLAVVRFLNAAKPSEPHIVPFLLEEKGFTSQQILHDIFPIVTYSNLLATALLPFAVSPRILGVKGCSIVAALARIATRILLIYGTSLASIQVSEACFGVVLAGEIALDAYVVQMAPESLCMRAVALSSTAAHLGYLLAAEGGALALATGASYDSLFWMSLVTIMMASALTMILPAPLKSSEIGSRTQAQAAAPIQNEAGMQPAQIATTSRSPSSARHFTALVHDAPSPRNQPQHVSSGRPRQNSESDQKQLLPGPSPIETFVSGAHLVHALGIDTPSPSSQSSQQRAAFTTECTTDVQHDAENGLSDSTVPTGATRCDRSTKNSSIGTAECTPLVQQQQQQQQHMLNGWSEEGVACKQPGHDRFAWVHAGTVAVVLGKVGACRHLLLLSLWWVAVSGPVMVFTESFCSNLFAEIDDAVEHNGHVEALAALARILGASLAPALQPLAVSKPGTVHCSWLLACACCVLSLACSARLLQAYMWYIATMGMMQVQLCLVQAQAGLLVSRVDAGALFGILSLGSITLQSTFQVVLQASGWGAQTQFLAVGLWAVLVSACCGLWWFLSRRSSL